MNNEHDLGAAGSDLLGEDMGIPESAAPLEQFAWNFIQKHRKKVGFGGLAALELARDLAEQLGQREREQRRKVLEEAAAEIIEGYACDDPQCDKEKHFWARAIAEWLRAQAGELK